MSVQGHKSISKHFALSEFLIRQFGVRFIKIGAIIKVDHLYLCLITFCNLKEYSVILTIPFFDINQKILTK